MSGITVTVQYGVCESSVFGVYGCRKGCVGKDKDRKGAKEKKFRKECNKLLYILSYIFNVTVLLQPGGPRFKSNKIIISEVK